MLEVARKNQQNAGRNACYGGLPRSRMSASRAMPPMSGMPTEPPPSRAESNGSARHY